MRVQDLELVTMPSAEDLLAHLGHYIEVAYYGTREDPANVALECTTCYVVLMDFDQGEVTG